MPPNAYPAPPMPGSSEERPRESSRPINEPKRADRGGQADRVRRRPGRKEELRELDLSVLRAMRTRWHTPGMEAAAKAVGKAGNNAAVWVILGLVLALIDPDRRESWLICALLGPFAIGLNYGIKLIVKRPRPVLEGLPSLGGAPSSLSFPSAHATSSFAVAVAMVRVDPATASTLLVAAALSLGRPYLGMHYPSDVLAGAVLGVFLGLIVPLSL